MAWPAFKFVKLSFSIAFTLSFFGCIEFIISFYLFVAVVFLTVHLFVGLFRPCLNDVVFLVDWNSEAFRKNIYNEWWPRWVKQKWWWQIYKWRGWNEWCTRGGRKKSSWCIRKSRLAVSVRIFVLKIVVMRSTVWYKVNWMNYVKEGIMFCLLMCLQQKLLGMLWQWTRWCECRMDSTMSLQRHYKVGSSFMLDEMGWWKAKGTCPHKS